MKQGWEIKKIKEICDKATSNLAQNKITAISGQYPVYGASGFVQNIDFYHRDTPYIGIVKDGAGVGRINIYPAFSSILGTMQYILPKDGFLLNYIAYALKGINLASFSSGATIPHIYFKDYGEKQIPVPPLAEQERIVAELDCLSGVIEKKKQQLKELDALAQSIFYEMFGDPITNEKGWEVKKWEDILSIVNGRNQKTVENPNGEYPIYGSGGVMGYADKYLCPRNTVIIGRKGNINKPIFVKEPFWNVDTAFGLISDKINVDSNFLYFFCRIFNFEQLNKAVTIPSLTKSDLLKINMVCPPLSLQQAFASKIEAIEKQKELIKQSIKEVETLFNSRMDYYFN
jgi:type I restriction enzyme S subunit